MPPFKFEIPYQKLPWSGSLVCYNFVLPISAQTFNFSLTQVVIFLMDSYRYVCFSDCLFLYFNSEDMITAITNQFSLYDNLIFKFTSTITIYFFFFTILKLQIFKVPTICCCKKVVVMITVRINYYRVLFNWVSLKLKPN